jgi:hypothetical protein
MYMCMGTRGGQGRAWPRPPSNGRRPRSPPSKKKPCGQPKRLAASLQPPHRPQPKHHPPATYQAIHAWHSRHGQPHAKEGRQHAVGVHAGGDGRGGRDCPCTRTAGGSRWRRADCCSQGSANGGLLLHRCTGGNKGSWELLWMVQMLQLLTSPPGVSSGGGRRVGGKEDGLG